MKKENTYDTIADVLNNLPENYKIMEEVIDLEVQREYYEQTQRLNFDLSTENIPELINQLYSEDTAIETLKEVLLKLALVDSVETYRAIEKYNQHPSIEIKDWSVLALQQSRMVLQSSLLGEQQVYISTGLGGKENKLRYFLIFPYNKIRTLSPTQSESLHSELKFFILQNEGEVEEVDLQTSYATALVLIPLTADIPTIVKEVLSECNQLGNYLSDDVLITNMKKFKHQEITEILEQHDKQQD